VRPAGLPLAAPVEGQTIAQDALCFRFHGAGYRANDSSNMNLTRQQEEARVKVKNVTRIIALVSVADSNLLGESMHRKSNKCPNCDVYLRVRKESLILFAKTPGFGLVSAHFAPLKIGLVARPSVCPRCGLVQLYELRGRRITLPAGHRLRPTPSLGRIKRKPIGLRRTARRRS
jgi:ribosomal protein S27AE